MMKRRADQRASTSDVQGLTLEVMRCLEAWGWEPFPVDEDLISFDCDGILGAAHVKTGRRNKGSHLTLAFVIDPDPHGEPRHRSALRLIPSVVGPC